jgi:GntR family transcriptional regulator, transcriptional repressor for pyruvate dehydrogenase complex
MKNRAVAELDQARALLKGAVPSGNVFAATVERIGQSVKLGLFAPGEQLPAERDLADLIGVSRTTVRAAIQVLVTGGFLVVRRGRGGGTFVASRLPPKKRARHGVLNSHTAAGVEDLLDRRLVLECGVAELAAERATKDQIKSLRELAQRMAQNLGDLEAYRRIDSQFHIALAQATGSSGLIAAMADMHASLSDLIALIPRSDEALKHSNEQHARIIAAVSRCDATAARREIRQHIEGTARFLRGILPRD